MVARSHELPVAACKRVLLESAPKAASRMGDDASKEARNQLELVLKQMAMEAAKLLVLTKRRTLNIDILVSVISTSHACKGIDTTKLSNRVRTGKGQRGLGQATVERLFRDAMGGKYRMSAEASAGLVGAAEAYLGRLGHVASTIALASKRKTIQAADVAAAASL